MIRRAILILPLAIAGCLPLSVNVLEVTSQAVIDGASVTYAEDYLSVTRGLQPLTNSQADKEAARAAVHAHCGAQGLGYLDRSVTFSPSDASWRFRGNCVYPDGTPLTQ